MPVRGSMDRGSMDKEKKHMRWNRFFNRLSFAGKLRLLFCWGIFIPMFILNMVNYWQTEKNVQQEIVDVMNRALDDKAVKINKAIEDALSLAKSYYNSEILYQYLDYEYERDLEYLILYQEMVFPIFSASSLSPYHIRTVHLYTDNPTLLNGTYISRIEEVEFGALGELSAYHNLQPIARENDIFLEVSGGNVGYQGDSDGRRLSIQCELDHYKLYDNYRKIIRVDLDIGYLEGILEEAGLMENVMLTDSQTRVFAAAKGYTGADSLSVFDVEAQEGDRKTMTLSRQVGRFPLTLYGIYDMRIISKEFRRSQWLSLGISVACLLLALGIIYAVVGNINRRLERLVQQSVEISKGNFVQNTPEGEGRDEFGVLEGSLNRMSSQLEELIAREYEARIAGMELEKESNRARFLALQSQVNPHFMFNALESIRLKSLVKGERETAGVIGYMAKMFRNLLEWDNNIITVKEEIGFLDEFLHIQSYRFEDEFSYEIEVSGEAQECLIPKMILQPLVENACVHGVEAISNDRWVRVEGSVNAGVLEISVQDNGGGMSAERLLELRAMLSGERKAGKSVGLWNVNRRLVLYYGEEAGLKLDSVPGKGTKCSFRLPVRKL